MLRVTIEIVPHGVESRAKVIDQVEIVQVHAFDDDPGGRRRYLYSRCEPGQKATFTDTRVLDHERRNGAAALVAKALDRLPAIPGGTE